MILRIQHTGNTLYLSVPDEALVYDGKRWLPPSIVERVLLRSLSGSVPPSVEVGSAPEDVYPVQLVTGQFRLTFDTEWVCEVLERGSTPPDGVTPISLTTNIILDPPFPEGAICMTICSGTEIQAVQVI